MLLELFKMANHLLQSSAKDPPPVKEELKQALTAMKGCLKGERERRKRRRRRRWRRWGWTGKRNGNIEDERKGRGEGR